MTVKSALGSYIAGTSVVHETRAQVKVILTCAFSIGVFFVGTWEGMGLFTLLTATLYLVARVPLGRALRGLGPVLFVLVFTIAAHSIPFTLDGFLAGLFVAARIALLLFACMLLTFTTSPMALADGLAWLLSPLRRLHVPIDDFVLVVSLALRFVPVVTEEAYAVRKAQLARCADFEAGSLLARAKAWVPVLVPLVVRLFRRAEDLARAMEARCYGGGPRTHAVPQAMRARDWAVLCGGLALVIALCAFL